jgi:hypothetical protein
LQRDATVCAAVRRGAVVALVCAVSVPAGAAESDTAASSLPTAWAARADVIAATPDRERDDTRVAPHSTASSAGDEPAASPADRAFGARSSHAIPAAEVLGSHSC